MGVILTVLMTVLNFILKLLSFLAKALYKLFRLFGLHIPLVYLIVMLIVELATGRGISRNPQYASLFWLGLVLSFLCAAWFLVRRLFFPKRKKERKPLFSRTQPRVQPQPQMQMQAEQPVQPQMQPQAQQPLQPQPAPAEIQFAPTVNEAEYAVSEPVPAPLPIAQPAPEQPLRAFPQKRKKERPKIYRVRQDERYLVYEYEDRTELYFERADGLRLVRTDPKR